jgi:zinc transport system substrate-binding protein
MNMPDSVGASETAEKKIFVATIYPVAIILKEIVGNQNSVEILLSSANSPHTFEPKPSDIRKIEKAAALFYVGPNLDKEWISKLPAKNKIEMLALLSDEEKLFMAGDSHHHGDHDSQNSVDPHFWTDPLLVKSMLDTIVAVLVEFAPENAEIYKKNAREFSKTLDQLNDEIMTRIYPVKGQPIILFHPSFNYFMKRYDLFLAGIIEPAPGKEPSPKFIHQTLKKMHTVKAKALFSERQSSKNSVQVLAEAAGVKAYELDPIGGIQGRENYRDLLLYNVQTFVKAFR